MTAIWTFLRHYLTESEAWMLLPVLAAVCVAIGSFVVLQSAIDTRSTVTDAEKADWKRKLADEGGKVVERAKQKAAEDAAAIKAALLPHDTQLSSKHSATTATKQSPTTNTDATQPATAELRQRKTKPAAAAGEKQKPPPPQQAPADDSGAASDNDWELVDDERIERAEESLYVPPSEYEDAVNEFVEALHELPQSAVEELHAAVKNFYAVLTGLLDGSSHVTPLPSGKPATPSSVASQSLSPTARYATRNVLLAHIVDTQSLHALHQVVEAHPGTTLAADAEHLHALLVPLLHSH